MATSMLSAQKQLPRAMAHPELSIKPPTKKVIEKRIPKTPLTVLVCTPDASSELAQRCLKSLRETTDHIQYTLVLEDNRGIQPFSHATAINDALDMCKGNLVICDDDITFTPGWLDSALNIAEAREDCGVVAFHLYDEPGKIWASAMWNEFDGTFHRCQEHFHLTCCIPSQCSACWLITNTDLRMNTRYQKCRFEHVFCYELWERGKKVYLSPSIIYHDKGGQFNALVDDKERGKQYAADMALYVEEWTKTNRERDVYRKMGLYMPETIMAEATDEKEGTCSFAIHPARKQTVPAVKQERLAVCTIAIGEKYQRGIPLMRRYARKIGADFFVFDEKWLRSEYSPFLLKWRVNALFEMGYTRVLYVDGDVMILQDAPNIFDAVNPGTLGVFDEAPILRLYPMDRKTTCQRFVKNWNIKWGKLNYEYPGHYFNAGVVVCEPSCNPFVYRDEGVYCFNNDPLVDQTYLNVISANMPKTLLDWKWNRMGIELADKFLDSKDMIDPRPYFAHYCGMSGVEKQRMEIDYARVLPEAIERKPGVRQQGLFDLCAYIGGGIENMVETGSAHGESLDIFTECWPNVKALAVDPWDTKRYGEQALADFHTRHDWNKNVSIYRGYGMNAVQGIPDASLDFFYDDSIHEEKELTAIIKAWLSKVKSGGWIGGHDYTPRSRPELPAFMGVCKAVNAVFGAPDMVFQDSSWLVRVQ